MPVGFYELLQISPDASAEAVRAAYQEQVAQVVRKQRAAEARQQDTTTLLARRTSLAEAYAVLSEPARRRRYDRFRELSRGAMPVDPEELWAQAGPSLVDPAAAAALEVVRTLTDLRVGDPFGSASPSTSAPAEPERPVIRVVEESHGVTLVPAPGSLAAPASPAPPAAPPPLVVAPPPAPPAAPAGPSVVPAGPSVAPANVAPAPARPGPRLRTTAAIAPPAVDPAVAEPVRPGRAVPSGSDRSGSDRTGRPVAETPPVLNRAVSSESLARLMDQYGPTGAYLRAVREARRLTVDNLSSTTRISQRFLEALERDAYNDLPAATFVRGYLRMIARALEILDIPSDLDEFVDGYMSRYHRARG